MLREGLCTTRGPAASSAGGARSGLARRMSAPRARSSAVIASGWLLHLGALHGARGAGPVAEHPQRSRRARRRHRGGDRLSVSDIDRSVVYRGPVGSRRSRTWRCRVRPTSSSPACSGLRARVVTMQLGSERIELTEYLTPRRRAASDSRSNNASFSTSRSSPTISSRPTSGCAATRSARLDRAPAAARTGTRRRVGSSPSSSEQRWMSSSSRPTRATRAGTAERIFLGIDHTAIVVADTKRQPSASIGTRSACGWPGPARTGSRAGAAQPGLRGPAAGSPHSEPGIELLEYLTPHRPARAGGRGGQRPGALAYYGGSQQAAAAAARLRAGRADFVSPGGVAARSRADGAGFLARDPNGHALRVISR